MSQFPHDEFVKEYIPELIKDYGTAKAGENINSERREIDVFFQPTKPVPTTPETLGLLGKLAQTTVLFEVFRNPVESYQIKECLAKLFDVELAIRKDRRKSKDREITGSEPFLWILTPTLAESKLTSLAAKTTSEWGEGIYLLPPEFNTGIVVIHQLPVNLETLWLRILGKGKVQENAVQELKALPADRPSRENVLELIGNLLAMLEANKKAGENLEAEERELIMKLSPIYLEKLEESKQIGIQEGANLLVIRLLKRKFGTFPTELETEIGSLSLETLSDLGDALLDFNSVEDLKVWLRDRS